MIIGLPTIRRGLLLRFRAHSTVTYYRQLPSLVDLPPLLATENVLYMSLAIR